MREGRGLGRDDSGHGGGGRDSRQRAIPRAWLSALGRCPGLCDTAPPRLQDASAPATAGLYACSAPPRTSVPLSFPRSAGRRQQGRGLFNLPSDLVCHGQEGGMMGQPHLRPGGAESGRTAAQQLDPRCQITIFDLGPTTKDVSDRTPVRETLLGCHRNQLVRPLIQGWVVSRERKQSTAECQARSQRRRMSQPAGLGDCRAAPCQCLVGKSETEQDKSQKSPATPTRGSKPGLTDERALGDCIVKC